jgi:hypothetical protein
MSIAGGKYRGRRLAGPTSAGFAFLGSGLPISKQHEKCRRFVKKQLCARPIATVCGPESLDSPLPPRYIPAPHGSNISGCMPNANGLLQTVIQCRRLRPQLIAEG